jgi:hypothetical protein
MFGIEKDFQKLMEQVYGPLGEKQQMTEIEEVKAQIQVLEKKLSFLEEIENHKTPCEKAYRDAYGSYPVTDDMSGGDMDYVSWSAFQAGYNAAYEEKVSEWEPTPQTPEQTSQSLKEAFVKAQQTENWKEIQKKLDAPAEGIYDNIDLNKLLEKWEKDPPEFLKFELGKTLTDLIYRWWEDVFTTHSDWDMETSIEDLVDQIEMWLPKPQSAAGSQSIGVEELVQGFNDCLNKIKSKLR